MGPALEKSLPRPEEPSSNSSEINATPFRRRLTLIAIALLKRIRKRSGDVLFLTNRICVKYSTWTDLSEAATMVNIRQNTSIPVPKIYCAFVRNGSTYIVMERIRGKKLAMGWLSRSDASRARMLAQLRAMIDEMRRLKSPFGSAVAGVNGGSLHDPRLPGLGVIAPVPTARRFGPFADVRAFHRFLRRPAVVPRDIYPPDVNELIEMHEDTEWVQPVFTHGDLSSLNIIVRGENVVGIVDWETAGWYPDYWEYTTASQVNFGNLMWADYIDSFLEPRTRELKMERIRFEFFGN